MARTKIKSATDQRKFTIVYNDFLESSKLNANGKILFITLKKFADSSSRAFPSLNTLKKMTGLSVSTIRRSIASMEELGVLRVEHRIDNVKGKQSNLYTLYDYAALWDVGSSSEELAAGYAAEEEVKMIRELEARGYKITKKEPDILPTRQSSNIPSTSVNQYDDIHNNNIGSQNCQVRERYTMPDIQLLYDYGIMAADHPEQIRDIDTVMGILYDVLNSSKQTIRVEGENKPSMVVISRLVKLNHMDIMYAIGKFQEQTARVKNPKGYMLTLLYNAKEQMHLDITNQVQHDLYG